MQSDPQWNGRIGLGGVVIMSCHRNTTQTKSSAAMLPPRRHRHTRRHSRRLVTYSVLIFMTTSLCVYFMYQCWQWQWQSTSNNNIDDRNNYNHDGSSQSQSQNEDRYEDNNNDNKHYLHHNMLEILEWKARFPWSSTTATATHHRHPMAITITITITITNHPQLPTLSTNGYTSNQLYRYHHHQ